MSIKIRVVLDWEEEDVLRDLLVPADLNLDQLHLAILQSFQVAGATIVDQFTVSDQFQTHMKNEMRERGGCPAGVLTSIFSI